MGDLIRLTTDAPAESPRPESPRPEPLWREQLGAQLRAERQRAGLRLVDVARRAGISTQYLSEVERGLKDPSSELLAAISGALGLQVREVASRVVSQPVSTGLSTGSGPLCLAS